MKKKNDFKELGPEQLSWTCDPKQFKFKTTDDIEPLKGIIGQERACRALRLGVDLFSPGYNVFVCGLSGTGKTTTIKELLESIRPRTSPPLDRCYVYNFRNPDQPTLITLDRGMGIKFKQEMEELVETLKKNVPLLFEDKKFLEEKETIVSRYKEEEKKLFSELEETVQKQNFVLAQIQMGPYTKPDILYLYEGKPLTLSQFQEKAEEDKIPSAQVGTITGKYQELRGELSKVIRSARNLSRDLRNELDRLVRESVSVILDIEIREIGEHYKIDRVNDYLKEVRDHILDNIDNFSSSDQQQQPNPLLGAPRQDSDPFLPYKVNVVLDNSNRSECPVIVETYPTYTNLFGPLERELDRTGHWVTDFTKIKGGSLLEADGGYLVMNAIDALLEFGVWKSLKRTLINSKLEIRSLESIYQLSTSVIKPEPIDINLKVIMVGDQRLYHVLYNLEEDFRKVFKVKVDFDTSTDLNKETIQDYASFIKTLCDKEKLAPFDCSGVSAILEYAVRKAGRRSKISTRFSSIADLLREADYWRSLDKKKTVTDTHGRQAVEEREKRHNLNEEKLQELIEEDVIMIDTTGRMVGQVNGLAVYDSGDYSFGKPSRITASISTGKSGIINIEREAKLSGKTHDKGVLILTGFVRERFAQESPLTLSAAICFEQSYGMIDGDSASSTELYALLSALSGVPIKQNLAVTGSVNQKGEVQPIGGINEKIEGFYDVCKAKSLTGDQGVLLPIQNVEDLMLRWDVIEAVKKKQFHIYPVETIDRGIEILTGVKAGEKDKKGRYPEGTINYLVEERLKSIRKNLEKSHKESPAKKKTAKKGAEKKKKKTPRKKTGRVAKKKGIAEKPKGRVKAKAVKKAKKGAKKKSAKKKRR